MTTCPKCKSEKVRIYDNEALAQPSKSECEQSGYQQSIEWEVYASLVCDNCDNTFNQAFDMIEVVTQEEKVALKLMVNYVDPNSELHKALISLQDKLIR